MAKKKRDKGQAQALTKKQIARNKRVARQQRTIWLAVASVTALVLIVLAVGLVQEYVLAPRQPVAVVDGKVISRAEYQKRVRYARWYLDSIAQNLMLEQSRYDPNDESQQFVYQYLDSQLQQVQQQQLSVPGQVLDDLIDEALVRQEAERRGLTVSGGEVQLTIEQQFGYERNPPEPTPTPITTTTAITPTTPVAPMTKEEFDTNYNEYINTLTSALQDFSEEDFRYTIEQSLLREKLAESLAEEVPTMDEHVHAYHILLETEEMAQEVLERLKAGEDFSALIDEYSQGEETVNTGGELGWLAKDQSGVLVTLVEAAFALQPGEFSEPIQTYQGYEIVTIDERQSERPLDEATLNSRQAQAIDDWLTQAREEADIERDWSPEDVPAS
ncbi:MAG: hypothetical protein B6I34_01810 [Anaerolineaceae bacterium 4572_32.1]|nr:MAG: hypothetical protein B6I34_01810 [Anaerolineaceae bacterium 4572_32.1]